MYDYDLDCSGKTWGQPHFKMWKTEPIVSTKAVETEGLLGEGCVIEDIDEDYPGGLLVRHIGGDVYWDNKKKHWCVPVLVRPGVLREGISDVTPHVAWLLGNDVAL